MLRAVANQSDNVIWNEATGTALFQPTGKYSPVRVDQNTFTYANGSADDGTPATHDASGGAVPSFTTAKRGQVAIVSVAGTLGGSTVAQDDYLIANQDSPTTAAHWDVVSDCAAEVKAACEAAGGQELYLYGTFFGIDADIAASYKLRGDFTVLNKCGYTFIYSTSNTTYAQTSAVISSVASITRATATDPTTGDNLHRTTRCTLTTVGEAANFKNGDLVKVICDTASPNTAADSSKAYISAVGKVQFSDAVNGYVWLDGVMPWHTELAAATTKHLVKLNADRAVDIEGMLMMGAPTRIGESVGWWKTLFGDVVTGTVTAGSGNTAGSTRTVSRTNHGLVVNQWIQVNSDTSVKVTSVGSANSFTFTINDSLSGNAYKDMKSGGSPVAVSIATSGSISYRPVFTCSEFNNTTHGAHIILNHANKSRVKAKQAKLWAKGLSKRHSNFCRTDIEGVGDEINPLTALDYNVSSGRLMYHDEDYNGSCNEANLHGTFGRHGRTGNRPTTSTAYSGAASFVLNQGLCTRNKVWMKESFSSNGADSHDDENELTVISEHYNNTVSPYAESYRPFIGNNRGSNEKRKHIQRGGYEGHVLRAYERQAGAIEDYDLDISDIPVTTSGSPATTNQIGFRTEDHSSITNKPTVTGRMKFRRVGVGAKIYGGVTCNLHSYTFDDIGHMGLWMAGSGVFRADTMNLDFTKNTEGQTTRYAIVMDASAEVRINVLNITLGASVNPAEIFNSWNNASGKIVHVNILNIVDPSGVGIPNLVESGRIADFDIKIGTVIYNGVFGFYDTDGSNRLTLATGSNLTADRALTITTGDAARTLDLIGVPTTKGDLTTHDGTNTARLAVGSNRFYPAADSNDANGIAWRDIGTARPTLRSGGYLSNSIGVSSAGIATGKAFAVPVYVPARGTYTAISFCVNTSVSISYKTALYADSAGAPAAQVSGTAVTSAAQTTAGVNINVDNTFSSPVTINAGWYWMVFTPDGTSTMQNENTVSSDWLYGAVDTIPSIGTVAYITHTYANALPDPLGALTFASQASNIRPPRLMLKKQ